MPISEGNIRQLPGNDFSNLVEVIVESYHAEPKTCHIDTGKLPNHDAVVEIIHLLRELLFPGYFGKQNLSADTIKYHVGDLLIGIHDRLLKQVQCALSHKKARLVESIPENELSAKQIVTDFLQTLPRLRAVLSTDVQAAFDGDPAAVDTDEIIFSYPGFFAITVYRLAHELYLREVPLIPRIMSEYAHSATGIDIHPGATIDEFFFIDHGTGVVIGETSTIGKHVKLYQGVTLGALSTRGGQTLRGVKRHPNLEDEVTVYSGASILGGETFIRKGVIISSNVFVTQSVPPNTRVTVKNPELQYRDKKPKTFKQELPLDWQI
jgi:serine O-acetyltransferase